MKRLLVLILALMMLCTPVLAEAAWSDGTFALGDTGFTVYFPGEFEEQEITEENMLTHAATPGISDNGGVAIAIFFTEETDVDTRYSEAYAEMIQTLSEGYSVIDYATKGGEADLMWQISQGAGQPCARLLGGKTSVGSETVTCFYAELNNRGPLGMMGEVIIPAENGVYSVVYTVTAEYMDTMSNLVAGTIAFE